MSEGVVVAAGILVLGTLVFGGVGGCMYVAPQYNVYSQKMDGEAELAKAESTRRTRVLEAQALKDSAQLQADAEVIRATGVAKANSIIADGLGGPEGYLRWKYIEMLENSKNHDVIYVPTEAGLPILEAGKRPQS
jgi:regulator of protease activity HflC (stomatin/prohibitin superfamily)